MGINFFDDLESSPVNGEAQKPFFTVLSRNDEDQLKWLNSAIDYLRKQGQRRTYAQRANLAAYRGLNWGGVSNRNSVTRDRQGLPLNKTERFKVNFLYNLTETRVSQLSRLKPAVQVLPNSNEFQDKNAAHAVKALVDHLFYENNVDYIVQQIHRHKKIFGEAFVFAEWDKNRGPVIDGVEVGSPLLDEHGNPEVDENGEEIIVSRAPRLGDVSFKIECPWRIFLQRKNTFDECEYAFRIKVLPVDEARALYPESANEIESDDGSYIFDMDELGDRRLEDETIIYEFYHKDTPFVPGGAYACFTQKALLKMDKLPYSHGGFPFERITDIDIPDMLNGVSTYDVVLPIQNMHDNITTLISKNIWLTAHAKWMMPRGAAKIESLGNSNTVVQYQGPTPPSMVQVRPNGQEVYQYRDILRQELSEVFGVHSISTGNPPSGVTAAVAMQFLNEQEAERSSTEIAKHNMLIQNLAKKTIAIAADNYDYDDERLIKILGKDNKYMIKYFDKADLNKSYDVRVDISTSLPDSKSGRIERIFQAMQYNRDMLPPERWSELLDLGAVDKMNSLITESIKTAESENEDMAQGENVADPEPWEEHIQHWHAHVKRMQTRSFKEEMPPEFRKDFVEHVMAHEYLMVEQAKINPKFSAELAQLSAFPLFYKDSSFSATSAQQAEAQVQGAANRGEPSGEQIPDMNSPQLGGENEQ